MSNLGWDLTTGEPAELPMPEGGHAAVQRTGQGQRPWLWDYREKSASFAYGVYDADRNLIAVGVVGPN